VTADGIERGIMTINRKMPGPAIQVQLNKFKTDKFEHLKLSFIQFCQKKNRIANNFLGLLMYCTPIIIFIFRCAKVILLWLILKTASKAAPPRFTGTVFCKGVLHTATESPNSPSAPFRREPPSVTHSWLMR